MAEKIKGQEPHRGQWVAPKVTEFTPDVGGALQQLYKAARCSKVDELQGLIRKAITCLKEDKE